MKIFGTAISLMILCCAYSGALADQVYTWTDNVRLIQALITTGAIDEYTAHILKHAYLIYRAAAHQASLQEKPARVPQEKFSHLRRRIEKIWNSFLK